MKNWLSKKENMENFSPFSNLQNFQKEMNQLFGRFFGDFPLGSWGEETFHPKVNVVETEQNIQVSAELPGMSEKDIDITLSENSLSIKGEKKQESEEKDKTFHRVERSYGFFQRSIPLPGQVAIDKVEANFKAGVLNITLPKLEPDKAKTKKIEIKTS